MEFQTLKRSHLKRNIIVGVLVLGIISAVVLNFTRAKYRTTQSIPLVNGIINYSPGDIIISAYFNNELLENFPTKDDEYAVETVTCDNGASATFNEKEWKLEIDNLVTRGTKCNIYFREKEYAKDFILAGREILTRDNFEIAIDYNTNGTIFEDKDDDGTTYYFAGNTTENYLQFGGFYWRIVRINGDNSIRIIYQGTSADSTGSAASIGHTDFNPITDNMYVGYMYASNEVHGLSNDSTIKKVVDDWYEENLYNTEYENYIDVDAGFCGDRDPYLRDSENEYIPGGGTGTTTTYYGAAYRVYKKHQPTFICKYTEDLYTTKFSFKGNKVLKYPIGLITADEVYYAGSKTSTENDYYLITGEDFWTISPLGFWADMKKDIRVFTVYASGELDYIGIQSTDGAVRPVINLKADIKLIGSGIMSDPYRIKGAE